MHIVLSSNLLLHFMKLAKDIKVPKEQAHFLDNLYIKASKENGGMVTFTVTNLKEELTKTIQTEVIKEGSIAFERSITDLIPKDEFIEINDDTIITSKRKIKTALCERDDMFFMHENFTEDYDIFELKDKDIKQLLEVKYAISKDISKPILGGIHIKKNEFSAIDGYRLSVRKGNFNSEHELTFSSYKPLEKMKGTIKATANNKYIKFDNDNYEYYNELIEGDFIAYEKLIPRDYALKVHLNDKNEIINNLKTYEKIAKDKKQMIKLFIDETNLQIEASGDKVKITDTFKCDNDTKEKILIAFNNKYLYELLLSASDDVSLEFTTNVNPVVAKCKKGIELLLPIRIASNI